LIKDKEHMANVFNEYFISIAETIITWFKQG
jgi:hypothetical protein